MNSCTYNRITWIHRKWSLKYRWATYQATHRLPIARRNFLCNPTCTSTASPCHRHSPPTLYSRQCELSVTKFQRRAEGLRASSQNDILKKTFRFIHRCPNDKTSRRAKTIWKCKQNNGVPMYIHRNKATPQAANSGPMSIHRDKTTPQCYNGVGMSTNRDKTTPQCSNGTPRPLIVKRHKK